MLALIEILGAGAIVGLFWLIWLAFQDLKKPK